MPSADAHSHSHGDDRARAPPDLPPLGGRSGGSSAVAAAAVSAAAVPRPSRDSSELLWDDINRPKFYTLLTVASACIRTVLYPAALVKTRLQASGTTSGGTAAAATAGAAAPTPAASAPAPPRFVGAGNTPLSAPHSASFFHPHAAVSAAAVAPGSFPTTLHSMPHYRGTGHAFLTILRTEGKFALYRGFRFNLLGLAVDPLVIGSIEYTRTRLTYYSKVFSPCGDGEWADHSFFCRWIMSPTTAITLLSAGSAACLGQVIQVPVDVITQKKQMQLHAIQNAQGDFTREAGTSSLAIGRSIVAQEGLRGLYKGFGVTLCSATPFQAILWAVYWPTQKFLARTLAPAPVAGAEETAAFGTTAPLRPDPHTGPPGEAHKFSSIIPTHNPAGIPAISRGPVPPPISLDPSGSHLSPEVREYLQLAHHHRAEREQRDMHLHHEEQGKGFMHDDPHQYAAHHEGDAAQDHAHPHHHHHRRLRHYHHEHDPDYLQQEAERSGLSSLSWREALPAPTSAFVASATASLATQPIDVIKTRLQVQGGVGTTIASTIRTLIQQRGYIGLMSGWYPRILAVSPGATIMMTSYEALKRYSAK